MASRTTTKRLPIFVGDKNDLVMAGVVIDEEPNKTLVTIRVDGKQAAYLAGFLTAPEPIAITIAGIPAGPPTHIKEKE